MGDYSKFKTIGELYEAYLGSSLKNLLNLEQYENNNRYLSSLIYSERIKSLEIYALKKETISLINSARAGEEYLKAFEI